MILENGTTLQIALFISVIWAIIPIIQKFALQRIPWRVLFFTNTMVQAVILIAISLFYNKQFKAEWNKTNFNTVIKYAIVLTILGITAFGLYYHILQTRNTFDVILLTSSYFIGTIILNAIVFKQALTLKQIIATLLVFIAVVLTT